MFSSRHKQKNKLTRSRRFGIKDENIDRQILVLHQAMAEKLVTCPDLIEAVKCKLEERRQAGKLHYGAYITWYSMLELIDDPDAFIRNVTEDTPKMRRLRRLSPLVGILTEQEKQAALLAGACGKTSLDTLL